MSHINTRYPFATANGNYIPSDILKATGTIKKNFVTLGFAAESLPVGAEVLRIWASEDCWFSNADAVALAPVNAVPSIIKPNICFLTKSVYHLIAIDPDILKYSLVRDTIDGYALIHVITKWNVLSLAHQLTDG